MTLHDAILHVLHQAGRPLSTREIADQISQQQLYTRTDGGRIEKKQIQIRVRHYNNLFVNINGQILPTDDLRWKELLTAYWYIVDTLKGYLPISDLQFLVSFLFYVKRRYPDYLNSDIKHLKQVRNIEKNLRSFQAGDSVEILDDALDVLSNLNPDKRRDIIESLNRIDLLQYAPNEFGSVFEYFLNLNSLDSSKSPIAYTPISLRELMVKLLDPLPGSIIYDPVTGTGGLLVELHKTFNELHFTASEANRRIAQLCFMNCVMNGIERVDLKVEDCFNRISTNEKYRCIIADLPINGMSTLQNLEVLSWQFGMPRMKNAKGFAPFIVFILGMLDSEGKAVVTVGDGFLSKSGKDRDVRRYLVEHDKIETIISLPFGALRPNTDAKASILVLKNRKKPEDQRKIRFIKAETLDSNPKSLILETDFDLLSKNSIVIDTQDLKEDLNLSADLYDPSQVAALNLLRDGRGHKLGSLVEVRSGINPERRSIGTIDGIPLVKGENLSKDAIDIFLESNQLTEKLIPLEIKSRYIINEDSIVVARIGESLKPTYFKPNDSIPEIVIHSGVYALKPIGKYPLDLEYLFYQLRSEFVKNQLSKRRLGAVLPYISIAGLKEIVIPYLDLAGQRDFIETQKTNIVATERARIEEKIKALGYKEEIEQKEADIVNTLAHQLRPTLANLDLEVKSLSRILTKNNLLGLKEFTDKELSPNSDPELQGEISIPHNYSIKELTEKISADALHINNVLDTIKKVLSFKLSVADMEEVDLLNFLNDYVSQKRIETNGKYEVEVKGDHFVVQLSKTAFSDLLNQLLINAEMHGFDFKIKKNKYRIQFTIRKNIERGIAIIEYQNNGKKFLLSHEDYVAPLVKGADSNGNGIGGNYINRIIEAHNGSLSIRENVSQGFYMTIEIPLKQDNTYE